MNGNDTVVKVDHATVRFNMASVKVDNLKEYAIRLIKRQLMFKEFLALQDVSLEVKKGEAWGIMGRNGSGKSTLLKLICGILSPYKGTENIFLNGALLGYSKKFMESKFDEIVEFAELRDFLEVPVKNYSSGMRARLGFAVATTVRPQLLVVDEVLAVGDYAFQQKCEARMKDMLAKGTTLLYVSHSANSVKNLCQKALWIDKGKEVMHGDVQTVCSAYMASMQKK